MRIRNSRSSSATRSIFSSRLDGAAGDYPQTERVKMIECVKIAFCAFSTQFKNCKKKLYTNAACFKNQTIQTKISFPCQLPQLRRVPSVLYGTAGLTRQHSHLVTQLYNHPHVKHEEVEQPRIMDLFHKPRVQNCLSFDLTLQVQTPRLQPAPEPS